MIHPVTFKTFGRFHRTQILGLYSTPELAKARMDRIEARCREEESHFIVVTRENDSVTVSGRNIAFETCQYTIEPGIEVDAG
jgi:hypothetical protein